jgi:enterochelin esterase family protein
LGVSIIETFAEFRRKISSTHDPKRKELLAEDYVKRRLSHGSFPVLEGQNVTFVLKSEVGETAYLVGDMNDWKQEADKLEMMEGTGLYYRTLKFPSDARIQYAFMKDGKWMADALNEAHSFEGYFGFMSELQMPNYKPPFEIDYHARIPHGKILTFRVYSRFLKNTRLVHVYLPPDYDPSDKYPTIYAQDGTDYLRYGFFDNVLDNLIHEGSIERVIGVFIEPVYRVTEYDLNDRYVDFFTKELVSLIESEYSTRPEPSKRLVMGPSFGGLISVYIAFIHPELFGCAASQSGYVSRKDDWVIREIERAETRKIKFYLDCGTYEANVGGVFGNFTDGNRRLRATLKKKGYQLVYQESNEGHNWENWRARIGKVVKTFFGI